MEEMSIAALVSEYGFPLVMVVGLGYFVYYVWWFVGENLEPEVEKQHFALIKLIPPRRKAINSKATAISQRLAPHGVRL